MNCGDVLYGDQLAIGANVHHYARALFLFLSVTLLLNFSLSLSFPIIQFGCFLFVLRSWG